MNENETIKKAFKEVEAEQFGKECEKAWQDQTKEALSENQSLLARFKAWWNK